MRFLIRYLSLLTLILVAYSTLIPGMHDLDFPSQPGPKFDRRIRKSYTKILDNEKPDIVMLGDSTLKDGVDPKLLSELTAKKISSFHVPGSASAFWYIVLKNNIVVSEFPPKAVIIVFRDTMLTAPGFRVQGGYFVKLDEFAAEQETILLDRAFLNLMNPLELWSERYFPIYRAREQIRKDVDSRVRYIIPGWLNCSRECAEDSMSDVFAAALEPGQLQDAMAAAEQYLYTQARLDFQSQVDKSFLPEMIRLTKENGIQLIVVRLKNQTAGTGNTESSAVKRYMNELTDYLGEQNVLLLDYGTDPRLGSEYFEDALHLNPKGEIVFTRILAGGLNEVLK